MVGLWPLGPSHWQVSRNFPARFPGAAEGERLLQGERDPDALARRIGELLDDPATRYRMGAEGRARVEQRFDIDRQTATLESLYDSLLSNAG
jgi:glycosyltransferase involved in cell wall biosynthesis